VAVVVTVLAVLGPMAWLVGGSTVRRLGGKDRADAINSVRQILLQVAAGGAALAVVVFTGRTFALSRRGQVTDRYTKAIGRQARLVWWSRVAAPRLARSSVVQLPEPECRS
jgi:hypothetical protein